MKRFSKLICDLLGVNVFSCAFSPRLFLSFLTANLPDLISSSLIRESLKIKILNLEEVDDAAADQCDEELRGILNKIWPYIDEKKREMCVPRNEGIIINISDSYFFFSKYLFFLVLHGVPGARVVTTGKIYAALLMVGNYRNYKTILEKELEQVSLIICNFVAFLLKNIV